MTDASAKSSATLVEMAEQGKEYREDYTFELYGQEVEVVLKPLTDEFFLPLMAELAESLGVDEEMLRKGEVDDELDAEIDEVDPSQMDEGFINTMQKAAVKGLHGQYDADGNVEVLDTEEKAEIVSSLVGGASVELGSKVMDVSGNIQDAEKFR